MAIGGIPKYTMIDSVRIAHAREKLQKKMSIVTEGRYQIITIDGVSVYWPLEEDAKKVLDYYCETVLMFHPHCYNSHNTLVSKGDIVIDCGACEGIFGKLSAKVAKKVYLSEPLDIMVNCLNKTFQYEIDNGLVEITPYAFSNFSGDSYFDKGELTIGTGYITEESSEMKVKVLTIDDFVHKNKIERVDFIKSDVEGGEVPLIEGATGVIKQYKPKIAITTYHYPDDAKNIVEKIMSIHSDYQYEMVGQVEFKEGLFPVMAHFW